MARSLRRRLPVFLVAAGCVVIGLAALAVRGQAGSGPAPPLGPAVTVRGGQPSPSTGHPVPGPASASGHAVTASGSASGHAATRGGSVGDGHARGGASPLPPPPPPPAGDDDDDDSDDDSDDDADD